MIVSEDARRRVVAHAYRLLRPGGIFVVHVHNRWFHVWTGPGRSLLMDNWRKTLMRQGKTGDFVMPAQQGIGALTMHLFTRTEILRLLRGVGFEIREVMPLSLQADGRLRCPWWLPGVRSYGYLIAARKIVNADNCQHSNTTELLQFR